MKWICRVGSLSARAATASITRSPARNWPPTSKDAWLPLPELIEAFGGLGCDVVEMVLADQDSWDRYAAAQWLNIRRWLDVNPGDELAGQMRSELATAQALHVRYQREYLGWGVFVLMDR